MAPRKTKATEPEVGWKIPKRSLVTGGCGFVGMRLVEMLVERGAEYVCAFDIAPRPANSMDSDVINWVQGDLTNVDSIRKASEVSVCVCVCVWVCVCVCVFGCVCVCRCLYVYNVAMYALCDSRVH